MLFRGRQAVYKKETLYRSTIFNVDEWYRNFCINNTQCNVIIKLSKAQDDTQVIPLSFWFRYKSEFEQPIYIFKNNQYTNYGYVSSNNVFYTDISKEEEGEVNIYLKTGGSYVYAKIVTKEFQEKGGKWNGRINYPIENSEGLLKYNDVLGKITYTKEDTAKCTNECELYINIVDIDELYDDKITTEPIVLIYSLYVNQLNEIVNFGKGIIININEYKYYSIEISADTENIVINYHSNYVYMYINIGDEKPTKENILLC